MTRGEAWDSLQGSLTRLVADIAREQIRSASSRPPPLGAELRKTVTDAVTAVLIESKLLDMAIEKHLKSSPPASGGASLEQGEVRGIIQKELRAFLASDELKELIDEKFRLITTYLKTDVIPKAVQRELQKAAQ